MKSLFRKISAAEFIKEKIMFYRDLLKNNESSDLKNLGKQLGRKIADFESIRDKDYFDKFKLENNLESKISFKDFKIIKQVLDKEINEEYSNNTKNVDINNKIRRTEVVCERLKEISKIDFENPYTSIKCGHMHRMALKSHNDCEQIAEISKK